MGRVENVHNKFNERYFYNVGFADKQLLDSDCVKRLMFVHKLYKSNVLLSDVVKSKTQMLKNNPDNSRGNVKEPSNRCTHNKPANISKSRILNRYGNAGQNNTVANDNVSEQYVPHMCNGQSRKVKEKNSSVKINSFIHTNQFQPLSDIDFNTVGNCHSVKVSTVVGDVGSKNTCEIPVATEKSITTAVKGKNKSLLYPNCYNVLDRGHVKGSKQT